MRRYMVPVVFFGVIALIHLGLAIPPALREKSWKRFFLALILSFAGIVLPVFIFMASAFLVPQWKGGCHHGWLDCFHVGKLALLPLVLWASAALYATDIYRTSRWSRKWIVLGLITGAVVSTTCLAAGIVIHELGRHSMGAWLLVPLYVSSWYLVRAWRLSRSAGISPATVTAAGAGSAPFWIASVIWSRWAFAALPDSPPGCFIATAAAQGHAAVVGSKRTVMRHGTVREATQQLATFWVFEDLWSNRAPRSHTRFRSLYNAVGPRIASQIRSPLAADAAHLMLKPAELAASAVIRWAAPSPGRKRAP